ncbi:MAG: HPr kinase/phosphatase C-terminal domain-containing protein [Sulfitobacter sp.]|jgi:HPr kinase/phosphorylase|uniref:HPr kinase/phosphorylase n=1 Tax=Sulfitobacter sp. TaxID=1903071 RepID=UPI003B61FA67|tara:strand:+ start:2328 stop:2753 length:426 start_codon:yes stop_codon:yes gene_type:complete
MKTNVHATSIAVDGRGVLILGASGQGKSSLALQLISLGAVLVADDRTDLVEKNGVLHASAPKPIEGMIEARGIGLLALPYIRDIPIYLIVDLDNDETDRLPKPYYKTLLDVRIPSLRRVNGNHFPASVFLYLKTMKQSFDD